jgi:hypothetical protein
MSKRTTKPTALLTEQQRMDAWHAKREIPGGVTIFHKSKDSIFYNWYKYREATHLPRTILNGKFWPIRDEKLVPDFSPRLQLLLDKIWLEFKCDAIDLTLNALAAKTDTEVADFLTDFWIAHRNKIDWILLRFCFIQLAQKGCLLTHLPNDWCGWLDESIALDLNPESPEVKSVDDAFSDWIDNPGYCVVPGDYPELEITTEFVNHLFAELLQCHYFHAQSMIDDDDSDAASNRLRGGSAKPPPRP